MAIRDILDSISAKLEDRVVLAAPATLGTFVSGTLELPPTGATDSGTLDVRLVDPDTGALGAFLLSGTPPTGELKGENFWIVTLSGSYDARTYYHAEVNYSGTGPAGEPNHHNHHIDDGGVIDSGTHTGTHSWLLHVNDERDFQDRLFRAAGLAGKDVRHVDWTYSRGNPINFTTKLYGSAVAVQLADSGTADNPIATYNVDISYDNRFNRIKIESTRTL